MTTPAWPGVAGLPAIPSRNSFQSKRVQLPFASENGETGAPEIMWGTGAPTNVVVGSPGDMYLQMDATLHAIWNKVSGAETTTGWQLIVSQGVAISLLPHGDTNYANGDGTPDGRVQIYSQLTAGGASGSGGADLQLIALKNRLGGADYDIHLVAEKVAGVLGTGVVFPDIDFKVADYLQSPFRGHGWRILQTDNSPVWEFPISGGLIKLIGRILGAQGANLDACVRIGGAAGAFRVEDHTGVTLASVDDLGAFNAKRKIDTVLGLASSTTPALDAALGNYFRCSITSNIAVVVQVPSNAPAAGLSQELTIEFINTSGGALTTPPTFIGGAGGFLFSAVTNPGNGLSVMYRFRWSSPKNSWIEVGTHLAAGL